MWPNVQKILELVNEGLGISGTIIAGDYCQTDLKLVWKLKNGTGVVIYYSLFARYITLVIKNSSKECIYCGEYHFESLSEEMFNCLDFYITAWTKYKINYGYDNDNSSKIENLKNITTKPIVEVYKDNHLREIKAAVDNTIIARIVDDELKFKVDSSNISPTEAARRIEIIKAMFYYD